MFESMLARKPRCFLFMVSALGDLNVLLLDQMFLEQLHQFPHPNPMATTATRKPFAIRSKELFEEEARVPEKKGDALAPAVPEVHHMLLKSYPEICRDLVFAHGGCTGPYCTLLLSHSHKAKDQ